MRSLHLPHWNSLEMLFSTCATMALFMFSFSSFSSAALRSSDFISSGVMVAKRWGEIWPDCTILRRLTEDLFLRFWKRDLIFCLYLSLTRWPALSKTASSTAQADLRMSAGAERC